MIYLNIIYYIIITWFGYTFLKSDGRIIKSPYGDGQYYRFTGPEMFWTLTFSTGLLAFSAPVGIDLMAIRLLTIMILCFIGLGYASNKPVWSAPLVLYVLYLIWLVIGCFYSPSAEYGFRVVLKYMYPLVFCLFASAVVDNFEVPLKSSLLARKIAFISIVFSLIPFLRYLFPGVFWYGTAEAINYISIMIFSIALFFFSNDKKKNLWYSIIFLAPCFIWVLRTSIMGSGVALMAFSIIRWRLKALPFILSILVAGIIAVFTIPTLRDKMFREETKNVSIENFQEGGLSMDDVDNNGRQMMWDYLDKHMFEGNELLGRGTGSVQQFMYNNSFLFNGIKIPHSDFVQIKCDNGIIAMYLYITISILIVCHCFKIYWRNDDDRIKLFAITAGASMLGVFVTLYSDNTVNYSMATLAMPYGFYGMTLALNRRLS